MVNNINWDVFDAEERRGIESLLEMRQPEHIAASIINMDGKKEAEIQKIMSQVTSFDDRNENSIREKIMNDFLKQNPRGIETPEQEAELQKELDAELASFQKSQQDKANALNEIVKPIEIKEEVKKVDEKKDLKKEPQTI